MTEATVHRFEAEVTQVLRLVIQSLYSNKEIFLRELISNASDALDKLRFRALSEPELLSSSDGLKIRLIPDQARATLTIWDNGIGMSREELARALGTVAWSGSREFIEKLALAQAGKEPSLQLIGQFGVGFYSAFLVADEVSVTSRAAGSLEAFRWTSRGEETFSIEPADRDSAGTSVTLHLKADQREYLDEHRLRRLVARYSDYIAHAIELVVDKDGKADAQRINQASALWQRQPKDIEPEQYQEFYKHLTHDWEEPLAWRHFHIEGTQLFTGLVFLPRSAPFDLFDQTPRHGVRLHVRRVLVMDNCEELVPRWLRFVRGVIDSEDLPLNVSREILQDSRAVRIIRKQIVNQTLEMLEQLALEKTDDYQHFFRNFGAVLKEGLHFEPELRDRLAELLRYESSNGTDFVSLASYVERMKEGQPAIYYATGPSRSLLESSPHLEALRKRDYEVLYMTDAVDPFALAALDKYKDKRLVSAMSADLPLGAARQEPRSAASESLLDRIKEILGERVGGVRSSERLTDSPACLVIPEGGLAPHVERLLRTRQVDLPVNKRILEVNLAHPLISRLSELHERDRQSPRVSEWVELLHDQALLAEGSPIENPAQFAKRMSELLTLAAAAEAGTS
jgi:molecular chaperone HtpG